MNYRIPACAVATGYYHYSSLPFGGPTFSISYISHIFQLSKGFLGLRLHAMHNDPVMTGPELNRLRHFSHYRRSFCLRGKRPWRRAPPLASSPSISTGARPWRSAPLSHQPNLVSTIQRTLQLLLPWVGPPRWIHKWFRSKAISLSSGSPPVAMERSTPSKVCWRELGPHQ